MWGDHMTYDFDENGVEYKGYEICKAWQIDENGNTVPGTTIYNIIDAYGLEIVGDFESIESAKAAIDEWEENLRKRGYLR